MSIKDDALFQQMDAQGPSILDTLSDSRKYLVFMINDGDREQLRFGVDAEFVVEILNGYAITYLPMLPPYLPGIINMRGQIVPVMDMRLRLDKYAEDNGLLIVLNYAGTQIGVLADAVDRIIDIPDVLINPVPSQASQRFVSGMCTIPDSDKTMMILDCEQLLAHE